MRLRIQHVPIGFALPLIFCFALTKVFAGPSFPLGSEIRSIAETALKHPDRVGKINISELTRFTPGGVTAEERAFITRTLMFMSKDRGLTIEGSAFLLAGLGRHSLRSFGERLGAIPTAQQDRVAVADQVIDEMKREPVWAFRVLEFAGWFPNNTGKWNGADDVEIRRAVAELLDDLMRLRNHSGGLRVMSIRGGITSDVAYQTLRFKSRENGRSDIEREVQTVRSNRAEVLSDLANILGAGMDLEPLDVTLSPRDLQRMLASANNWDEKIDVLAMATHTVRKSIALMGGPRERQGRTFFEPYPDSRGRISAEELTRLIDLYTALVSEVRTQFPDGEIPHTHPTLAIFDQDLADLHSFIAGASLRMQPR